MENRTADIIQETRKHIRKKPTGFRSKNEQGSFPQSQIVDNAQSEQEIQLKASRDVRLLMPCVMMMISPYALALHLLDFSEWLKGASLYVIFKEFFIFFQLGRYTYPWC